MVKTVLDKLPGVWKEVGPKILIKILVFCACAPFSHRMMTRMGVTFGKILNEIDLLFCIWLTLKEICKQTTHFRCHSALQLKSSLTSHLSVQKFKCTCLRTLKASIGTITTFRRRQGRSQRGATSANAPARLREPPWGPPARLCGVAMHIHTSPFLVYIWGLMRPTEIFRVVRDP